MDQPPPVAVTKSEPEEGGEQELPMVQEEGGEQSAMEYEPPAVVEVPEELKGSSPETFKDI